MAADRRPPTRGTRPEQRRRPGRGTARAGDRPRQGGRQTDEHGARPAARSAAQQSAQQSAQQMQARPRLTGRAAILIVVLAVLAVSYASSLRAYLQQRDAIREAQATIDDAQADIDRLRAEKQKWNDPEYQATQARARLGYVLPGETPFVVLRDGRPLEAEGELADPSSVAPVSAPAWYDDVWASVLLAGDPPRRTTPPKTLIDGTDEKDGSHG